MTTGQTCNIGQFPAYMFTSPSLALAGSLTCVLSYSLRRFVSFFFFFGNTILCAGSTPRSQTPCCVRTSLFLLLAAFSGSREEPTIPNCCDCVLALSTWFCTEQKLLWQMSENSATSYTRCNDSGWNRAWFSGRNRKIFRKVKHCEPSFGLLVSAAFVDAL